MAKLKLKKKKKKAPKPLPPAEEILSTLAGVLALGLPYNKKGICVSCHIKEGHRHHSDCHYHEAIMMVVKYYRP
jgi:hypothetical protein